MARYRVTRDHQFGEQPWKAGQVVEINNPLIAATLASNHEGLLERLYDEAPIVEGRIVEQAPHDRQVKAAKSKR